MAPPSYQRRARQLVHAAPLRTAAAWSNQDRKRLDPLWIGPEPSSVCSLYVLVSLIAYEAGDLLNPTPAESSDPVEPAPSMQQSQPVR